ncbi:MAG: hypothetical protein SPL80_00315, partial [Bacilli bacterium]|nr:hypothetical protein [Bacilli bacterium]
SDVVKAVLSDAAKEMPFGTDESVWFNALKEIGGRHGFALSNTDYTENPSAFVGSVSDCAELLRVAIVGTNQSPNLHEILEILGKEKTVARLNQVIATL